MLARCFRRRRLTSTAGLRHAAGESVRFSGPCDILLIICDHFSSSRHGPLLAVSNDTGIAGRASDSGPRARPESSARSRYGGFDCWQQICHQEKPYCPGCSKPFVKLVIMMVVRQLRGRAFFWLLSFPRKLGVWISKHESDAAQYSLSSERRTPYAKQTKAD